MSAKNRRYSAWLLTVLAGAVVLSGVWLWQREHARPQLPPVSGYSQLPARFRDVLAFAHRAAVAAGEDPAPVRRLARLYQANRLDDEARACYAVLARLAGGLTAQDHYHLADLALNAGDQPGAVSYLRQVLRAEPAYLPAQATLAEILFKSGEEAAAQKEYEAILAREPNHPAASLGLARLALQHGDDAAAITRLEHLLATHPETTSAAGLLAQVMDRRGEQERAEALTEWSRRSHDPVPADPWREELLADSYDLQRLTLRFEELSYTGQLEQAMPLLARVEELDPQSWLPHLLRGWTQAHAHREAEAVIEYRRALEKSGDPETIVPRLVPCLIALGRETEAVEAVENGLKPRPDAVPLLVLQADLAIRRHDNTRARVLLAALLKKEPQHYAANMSLSRILWDAGERDAAVVCLARAAKSAPADVASRGLLGQYYLEKGEAASAVVPLEQALPHAAASPAREQLSAMLVQAYLQTGSAEAVVGRADAAIASYEKAARLSPAGLEALAGLAGEWAHNRQFRQAAGALSRLAIIEPDNPTIQISLGDMLYQDGAAGAAREHWEKASALVAPKDKTLREALDIRLHGRITSELFN